MTYIGTRLTDIDTQVASVSHSAINTNIDSLGASTRLGSIKGVDRGSITCSLSNFGTATATIGAVVLARTQTSFSHANGRSYLAANDDALVVVSANGRLTTTTTITATSGQNALSADSEIPGRLSYEAVEFNS